MIFGRVPGKNRSYMLKVLSSITGIYIPSRFAMSYASFRIKALNPLARFVDERFKSKDGPSPYPL